MNNRLQTMAAETMAALQERKALPDKANSAEVRYAANYIVKKSPFAPYFKFLGIQEGSQIGRTFDNLRSVEFFKTVMQLYYAKWYFEDSVPKLNDIIANFKTDSWTRVALIAQLNYNQFLRDLRRSINDSKGIGSYAEYRHDLVLKDLRTLLAFNGTHNEFMKKATGIGAFHDTIVLAVHLTKRHNSIAYKAWLDAHQEEVLEAFLDHGKSRAMLSACHGFKITAVGGGYQSYRATSSDRSSVLGYTHATLNAMARAKQDVLQHRVNLASSWQALEANMTPTMTDNIFTTAGLSTASIPEEVARLAERLAAKHGPVTVTNEASGLHIYVPDPELLQTDGRKELTSKHLAINAEKYLGIGRYDVDINPTRENKQLYKKYRQHGKEVPSAISMKTTKPYSVDALLQMAPIERRVSDLGEVSRRVITTDPNKYLVYDAQGNLVPEWCGETVDIAELPPEHPARDYLEKVRHYDVACLGSLWDVCYCTSALPEDRGANRFYSRLPHGCKNSPTGRIIFPIYDDDGVRRGWQARIIDYTNAHGDKFVWTDSQQWLQVASNGQDLCVSEQWPKGFSAHKYLNARGSQRNALLFGLKQAVEYNSNRPFPKRYCVLVEGPLDAIRGGPPCIALLGKSISQEQAALIRKNFAVVCTVMDRDKAGQECLNRIYKQLNGMPIHELIVPEGKKDLGDCTYEEAAQLVQLYDPLK